ncbi:GNAT family N-acetyltransferase [Chitinophaga sp. G-6-1-13]|uniref:GNAT family N-acetyltransferase n=1 Tax=Chitinophaga fulva TaxID=2728842 RepID=A0A848GPX9_9BACT|nr:GNAT family N-acetyltransferase [Chitinophaga fulva]NML38843.1 GNAT family N-acetyltransferase [Chitinophaga fulva]
MLQLIRTDSGNPDFVSLVKLLDQDLAIRDGGDHTFYAQFNKIDLIKQAVVGYLDGRPVACGAIKPFSEGQVEVKRMFVHPDYRGKGLASEILLELEKWAGELGYQACVLETGKRQPEAIALYQKNGYAITENYGQYIGVDNSVCMRKDLPA